MKKILSIIYTTIFALLLLIGGALALSAFNTPLKIRVFSVLSGSMEPVIHTGSVVIVQPQEEYKEGDIVTFRSPKDPKQTFTHRIIKVSQDKDIKTITYTTKGDANEEEDRDQTSARRAIGKVIFTIPYAGYAVNFAQTQTGLIVLIVIPATIIVYSELLNIKTEIQKFIKMKSKKNKNDKKATKNTKVK